MAIKFKDILNNNRKEYPHFGFYFSLSFSGSDSSFQEASGLSMEMEYEEIASGGSFFKYRVPKQTKFSPLVLKRGVLDPGSPLSSWCIKTITDVNRKVEPEDFTLKLLDEKGDPVKTWSFRHAYPVKWNVSDLKSTDSSIAVETLEFVYHDFDVS